MRHRNPIRGSVDAFRGLGLSVGFVLGKVATVGRALFGAVGQLRDVGGFGGGVVAHFE